MIVRPWKKGDTARIRLQDSQSYVANLIDLDSDLTEISEMGLLITLEEDDEVLAVAGIIPQWENRAICWSLISKDSGKHFVQITREVKNLLDNCDFRRLEATVDVGFEQGHRWIKMLGFSVEGYMRAYRPDGADMILYARIKE